MATKQKSKKKGNVKKVNRRSPPGSIPGYINFDSGAAPKLVLTSYHLDDYAVNEFPTASAASEYINQHSDQNHWLQIIGYGNSEFFHQIKDAFHIHTLELEDVLAGNARPKLEVNAGHVFDINRMLYYDAEQQLVDDQMNVFFFDHLIITMQETDFDCLNPVRERIKVTGTLLRKSPVFYLYYAITDAVIDSYFPIVDHIEVQLESLEDQLFDNPEKWHLSEIQTYRKQLQLLRKTMVAEKDNLSDLIRNLSIEKQERFGIYLQDAFDHTVHILDLIEGLKEFNYSLLDIYMSSVNNKMGEVMKVLTVISSIFIPLSFIAGFYGMNFAAHNKEGNALPWNMPELYEPYGYLSIVGIMMLVAILQLLYFRRKKWL
ncbi:MAG: magnesium/cobalt transporter CorA [Bacteroidetes bacterium]|nr:MAG: magnesium/cobalt transporter CorA [Bacteroidota bacterium]